MNAPAEETPVRHCKPGAAIVVLRDPACTGVVVAFGGRGSGYWQDVERSELPPMKVSKAAVLRWLRQLDASHPHHYVPVYRQADPSGDGTFRARVVIG